MNIVKERTILTVVIALAVLVLLVVGTPGCAPKAEPMAPALATGEASTQPVQQVYTCPMHPEVTSDKPGSCPQCGMALVPKK